MAEGNNRSWNWSDNASPSTGIGACGGEDGSWATESGTCASPATPDGYAYTEMSSPGAFNDTFDTEFNTTLDAAAETFSFVFYTNQRGNNNNVVAQVQINESGGGWVNVGSSFGGTGDPDKVSTNGNDQWIQRTVDLSNSGANNDASTLVRILLTIPSSGTTWHNDYALDSITITGTINNSAPTVPTNILCDDNTDCDIIIDTIVLLNGTGSTDSESDVITYNVWAAIENSTALFYTNIDDVTATAQSGGAVVYDNSNDNGGALCSSTSCSIELVVADQPNMMIFVISSDEGTFVNADTIDIEANTNVGTAIGTNPIRVGSGGTEQSLHLWRIADSDITKGSSNTITVNYAASATGSGISAHSFYNVDQAAEEDTNETTQATSQSNISVSVTSTTNDAVFITTSGNGGGAGDCTYDAGQIEIADFDPTSAGQCVSYELKAIAGADTQNVAYSAGTNRAVIISAAFAPSVSLPNHNLTATIHNDFTVQDNWNDLDLLMFKVEVDSFNPAGSVTAGNDDPDLVLEVFDGTVFLDYDFNLPLFYTGLGLQTTDYNGTLAFDSSNGTNILLNWNITASQDFRLKPSYFDNEGGANVDEIIWKNMFVSFDGHKWWEIGNHTTSVPDYVIWDSTDEPNQTDVNLRVRAIDIDGSNTFSNYFYKGSNLEIAHGGAGHDPIIATDVWIFVESTSRLAHYVRNVTDTWIFVESISAIPHYVKIATDTWTFVESTNEVKSSIRTATDTWTFAETVQADHTQVRIGTDIWTFVESTNQIQHYSQEVTDTWIFVESTSKVFNHVPIIVTDTWTFIESTSLVEHFVRVVTDVWLFVESTNEVFSQVRSATDVWTFVETTDVIEHKISSSTDVWTFVETVDVVKHSSRNALDSWTFVETTEVVFHHIPIVVTDTWTFVESTDQSFGHVPIIVSDTWTFVESTNEVFGHAPIIANDIWTFVEFTNVILNHIPIVVTDTWIFVESTDVVSMLQRSATDEWIFVESTTVIAHYVRNATDTWIFVETTNSTSGHLPIIVTDVWIFIENVQILNPFIPGGSYIWFNLSPPELDRLGGVYAFECDSGEFIYRINTDGTVDCRVP